MVMTITEMRELKEQKGYTLEEIAEKSHKNTVSSACGVPANLSASYDLYRHVCLSSLYEVHQQ